MDKGYKLLFYASDIIGLFNVCSWKELDWMILRNNDVAAKGKRAEFWTSEAEKYLEVKKNTRFPWLDRVSNLNIVHYFLYTFPMVFF